MNSLERGEFPEEGELVLCRVRETFSNGAYVEIEEYGNKEGYVPLKEISLKWIKNIHDYLKEGQKVVLKVIKIYPEKNRIDLSLRRVTDNERKAKLEQVKKIQRGDKFLQFVSNNLKIKKTDLEKIFSPLIEESEFLIEGIEEIARDETKIKILNCDESLKAKILSLIKKNVKLKNVEVHGYLKLQSDESDGIERIKNILINSISENVTIKYISAPIYKISVTSSDYKTGEKILKNKITDISNKAKLAKCEFEFSRERQATQ